MIKPIPKETSVKRPQTTERQRLKHLKQWEASGLSAEAFAAKHAINPQSLYRWRMMQKVSQRKEAKPAAAPFRELKIGDIFAPSARAEPSVTLKNSVLEVSISGFDFDPQLAAFVKSLSQEVFGV